MRSNTAWVLALGLALTACSGDAQVAGEGGGDGIKNNTTSGAGAGDSASTGTGTGDGDGDSVNSTDTCTALIAPGATTKVESKGLICQSLTPGQPDTCTVRQPEHAIDGDPKTYASFEYALGALDGLLDGALEGSVDLTIDLAAPTGAGQSAAFLLEFPAGAVQAGLLDELEITTFLDGEEQERQAYGQPLESDLGNQTLAGTNQAFVGIRSAASYDSVRLSLRSKLANLNLEGSVVRVYDLCTQIRPGN